jgi:hypothetical protein
MGNAVTMVTAPRKRGLVVEDDLESATAAVKTTVPIDLNEIAQRKVRYDPKCFGCRCGFKRIHNEDDDPRMYQLFELFVQNKYKIGDDNLYREMQNLHYELYIKDREHMHDFKPEQERWTAEKIKEHVTEHVVFYELETHQLYNELGDCRSLLKRCTFSEEEASEKVVVDEKNYRMYLETIKLQKQILESILAKKTS